MFNLLSKRHFYYNDKVVKLDISEIYTDKMKRRSVSKCGN